MSSFVLLLWFLLYEIFVPSNKLFKLRNSFNRLTTKTFQKRESHLVRIQFVWLFLFDERSFWGGLKCSQKITSQQFAFTTTTSGCSILKRLLWWSGVSKKRLAKFETAALEGKSSGDSWYVPIFCYVDGIGSILYICIN